MDAIALPPELARFAGRIVDVDGHEMMPSQEWVRHFGVEVEAFAEANATPDGADQNHTGVPQYAGDIAPIGADIGTQKGPRAPGATDPRRRLDVLDALGIRNQLMFPGGIGLFGFTMLLGKVPGTLAGQGDPAAIGHRWMELYEEWAFAIPKMSMRVRPVLPLYGETPDELCAHARHLIDNGIRAVWMASGFIPGGRSPAHPDLDPLWALLAESDTVVTLHGGGEGQFLQTREWRKAPAFEGYRTTAEFDFDPWSMSIYHLPSQNFIATMVMGGVFERHPNLRLGAIELGAHWIGPLMENMDNLQKMFRGGGMAVALTRRPSDYVRSNVRVSPLFYEEVDVWIERHPGLEDVICFSTDYPHVEGGKNAAVVFYNRLSRLGDEVLEKFFVTNGALLFP